MSNNRSDVNENKKIIVNIANLLYNDCEKNDFRDRKG